MELGKRLAELMTEKQISQSRLAREVDIDQTTLSKVLLGKNNFSLETAIRVAKFFNVTLGQLAGTEEL